MIKELVKQTINEKIDTVNMQAERRFNRARHYIGFFPEFVGDKTYSFQFLDLEKEIAVVYYNAEFVTDKKVEVVRENFSMNGTLKNVKVIFVKFENMKKMVMETVFQHLYKTLNVQGEDRVTVSVYVSTLDFSRFEDIYKHPNWVNFGSNDYGEVVFQENLFGSIVGFGKQGVTTLFEYSFYFFPVSFNNIPKRGLNEKFDAPVDESKKVVNEAYSFQKTLIGKAFYNLNLGISDKRRKAQEYFVNKRINLPDFVRIIYVNLVNPAGNKFTLCDFFGVSHKILDPIVISNWKKNNTFIKDSQDWLLFTDYMYYIFDVYYNCNVVNKRVNSSDKRLARKEIVWRDNKFEFDADGNRRITRFEEVFEEFSTKFRIRYL